MKIICIGRNYAAHAEELNHLIRGGAEAPAERSRQAGDGAKYPSGLIQIGSATECTAELPRLNRNATGCTAELPRLDGGSTGCTAEPSPQAGDGAETLPERNRPGCGECSPEPIWFLKPDTALLRNNDPFYIPAFSQEVHYECELVVRIDRVGKSIAERFAHRYYKEVGLGIDFTACSGRPPPKVCRGSAARRSTAQRRFRRNSYLCRSWAATCRSCASRWR